MIMKKIVLLAIGICAVSIMASCREKPVSFDQLPGAAQSFISTYYTDQTVTVATKDDDLIRPDYDVRLSNGTELEFDYAGELKKVSSREGVLEELIPDGIRKYVAAHYPKAGYREYEVGKRTYEVKLTNGMELKFNTNFILIEIDD